MYLTPSAERETVSLVGRSLPAGGLPMRSTCRPPSGAPWCIASLPTENHDAQVPRQDAGIIFLIGLMIGLLMLIF